METSIINCLDSGELRVHNHAFLSFEMNKSLKYRINHIDINISLMGDKVRDGTIATNYASDT